MMQRGTPENATDDENEAEESHYNTLFLRDIMSVKEQHTSKN